MDQAISMPKVRCSSCLERDLQAVGLSVTARLSGSQGNTKYRVPVIFTRKVSTIYRVISHECVITCTNTSLWNSPLLLSLLLLFPILRANAIMSEKNCNQYICLSDASAKISLDPLVSSVL